jgi:transcriptional regulator with XRE-family HTH domain
METFGERLKKSRKDKSLSQTQLANLLGMEKHNAISNWEHDIAKPSADDLAIIAEILCVSVDWLLTGKKAYDKQEGIVMISNEDFQEYQTLKIEKLTVANERLKNNQTVSDTQQLSEC